MDYYSNDEKRQEALFKKDGEAENQLVKFEDKNAERCNM
jgi:hypothetical protein